MTKCTFQHQYFRFSGRFCRSVGQQRLHWNTGSTTVVYVPGSKYHMTSKLQLSLHMTPTTLQIAFLKFIIPAYCNHVTAFCGDQRKISHGMKLGIAWPWYTEGPTISSNDDSTRSHLQRKSAVVSAHGHMKSGFLTQA